MLVFVEEGKPENPEKNPQSKAKTNNKLNPHDTASAGIEPTFPILRQSLLYGFNTIIFAADTNVLWICLIYNGEYW